MKTKFCPKCRKKKDTELFSKNRTGADGLCSWCKDCMKVAVEAWNKKNRGYKNKYTREHRDPEYHRQYERLGIENRRGISTERGWTAKEDELCRTLSAAKASRKTGRTLAAVYSRRRH